MLVQGPTTAGISPNLSVEKTPQLLRGLHTGKLVCLRLELFAYSWARLLRRTSHTKGKKGYKKKSLSEGLWATILPPWAKKLMRKPPIVSITAASVCISSPPVTEICLNSCALKVWFGIQAAPSVLWILQCWQGILSIWFHIASYNGWLAAASVWTEADTFEHSIGWSLSWRTV